MQDINRNEYSNEQIFDINWYSELFEQPENQPGDQKQAYQLHGFGKNVKPQPFPDKKMDEGQNM